jgi:ABC-type multidrug transport system fused ATPase/permease subunit
MDPHPPAGTSDGHPESQLLPAQLPPAVDAVADARPATLAVMARRYWDVVRPERRLAVASVALSASSGVFEATALAMLVPLLEHTGSSGKGGLFTRLLEGLGFHGRAVVWAAVVSFAVLSLAAAVSKFAADSMMSLVRARTESHLRKDLTDRLLGMEWSAFLMTRLGDMASSLMMESSQVGAGIQLFLGAVGSIVVTLAFLALALLLSVRLTLVVVGFALVGFFVLRPLGRRAESQTRGLTAATTAIARQVTDILGNLKLFRSTGSRRSAEELFSEGYDEYATWFQKTQVSPLTIRLMYELSAWLFILVLLVVSVTGASTLSATTLVFLAIFLRLSPRIRDLQEGLVRARVQFPWLTSWDQRRAVAAAHQMRSTGTALPTFSEGISADGVSFAFPGVATQVLDDVSWELRPGESVAFVGESGAGKTTMLDLVTGLLVPTAGRMAVDGVSLTELDVEAWQSHIGLVLQDSPLFHATIRENIVGDRAADDDFVWECLADAHAKNFVAELPAGLETVIGERGGRLSGGQRQRVGLARALYRRPWLLILDEATSALDSVSENVVLEALRGLRGHVAMMIVAHRLATVEMADRIFVLEAGRIVQSGTWADLQSDAGGPFARMAAKQGLLVPASS